MEITKHNLQMARDSILGVAASFFFHGITSAFMGTSSETTLAAIYLICALVVAMLLLLPKRMRLATHVGAFVMISVLILFMTLTSVLRLKDAGAHLLFVFTTLILCHYGAPQGRNAFMLLTLATICLAAITISAAEDVYQMPMTATMQIRVMRALQSIFLYMGVSWQLWVIVIRPRRQLKDRYDRKIAHLDKIVDRYRCLIGGRLIRADEPGPDRARILDVAIEVMSDARAEGLMTKEELSFLHSVLEDCRREVRGVSLRMNATIFEARHLLERGGEAHSGSE